MRGAALGAACALLCCSLNYTFPLRRDTTAAGPYGNHSNICDKSLHGHMVDRTKKMVALVENALKIVKDNQEAAAPPGGAPRARADDDLNHYEQMVIMKKNPYLDLKELEVKLQNPPKSTRHAAEANLNLKADPGLHESIDEGPYVEIINRGLTGFAIPSKIKNPNMADAKLKLFPQNLEPPVAKPIYSKCNNLHLLETLKDDIRNFKEVHEARG